MCFVFCMAGASLYVTISSLVYSIGILAGQLCIRGQILCLSV